MSSTHRSERSSAVALRPSRYDRAASLLISVLILSTSSFVVLFVLWMGTHQARPNSDFTFGRSLGSADVTESDELEVPHTSELADARLFDPAIELSSLLSSDAIAAATQIDTDKLDSKLRKLSDHRPIGDVPKDSIPRWERWEIRYEASSLPRYARQLDYFGIELGAAGGGKPNVDYASRLATERPKLRSKKGSSEKRLYLTWRGGKLEKMDRQLLQNAGVDVSGRIVMQFYPQETEDMLALLESKLVKDGRLDKVRKTIFGVRPDGDGFEYFIIEQRL